MGELWRAAAVAVGVAAVAVAGISGWKAWQAEWARRNPEAARIARYEQVFDAAWKTVDEKYYDPKFDHARWRKVRDVYRPRVKAQTFVVGLYINVLHNMMLETGSSHVDVTPPMESPAAERPSRAIGPPVNQTCPDAFERTDFGFDFAQLRRGQRRMLVVDSVRRGGTAERRGIAPGDHVLEFSSTNPLSGCPSISLKLATGNGAFRTVTYDLDRRSERPTETRADLPSGVRVLRFDRFDANSAGWLARNLEGPPPRGLILDLRTNGGGEVRAETKIASYFLPQGADLGRSVEQRKTSRRTTPASSIRYEGPMLVLMGPRTASAAEVTAAVLRFHRRALLVGGETAGAVLTARYYRLPDGGVVDVAIADYLTPDGRRLEGVGVKPDLPVVQTLEAIRAGRDLPLEAAERALLEGRWRP